MTVEQCPTCGATVRVVSGYEGTSHYEPLGTVEALAKEVAPLSQQLEGAVEATAALREAIKALCSAIYCGEPMSATLQGVVDRALAGGQ
jgi:hypothetical protein